MDHCIIFKFKFCGSSFTSSEELQIAPYALGEGVKDQSSHHTKTRHQKIFLIYAVIICLTIVFYTEKDPLIISNFILNIVGRLKNCVSILYVVPLLSLQV